MFLAFLWRFTTLLNIFLVHKNINHFNKRTKENWERERKKTMYKVKLKMWNIQAISICVQVLLQSCFHIQIFCCFFLWIFIQTARVENLKIYSTTDYDYNKFVNWAILEKKKKIKTNTKIKKKVFGSALEHFVFDHTFITVTQHSFRYIILLSTLQSLVRSIQNMLEYIWFFFSFGFNRWENLKVKINVS